MNESDIRAGIMAELLRIRGLTGLERHRIEYATYSLLQTTIDVCDEGGRLKANDAVRWMGEDNLTVKVAAKIIAMLVIAEYVELVGDDPYDPALVPTDLGRRRVGEWRAETMSAYEKGS